MYDLKKAPQKQMCSKMFVHDCRYRRFFAHVASIYANFISSKESIYVRKEFQRIGFGHQHGLCFSDLEHQYGHMMSCENAL